MKKLLEHSSWMITAPLLLLTVIYLTVFFVPGRRELNRLRADLDSTVEMAYQAEAKSTRIEAIQADIRATGEYTDEWEGRRLSTPRFAELFGRIHALGRDAGTVFRSFNPETPVPMRHLDQMPVKLVCVGSYASLFEFVRQLESLPEAIVINSVDVAAPRKDGEGTQCSLNLIVFTGHSQDSD